MIEEGRRQNMDRNLRFGQICLKLSAYIVEDEFNLFIGCPAYDATRELYLKPERKNAIG